MKKQPRQSSTRSPEELSLLLAKARAHERQRCARAFSDRLDGLATHIYNLRLGWCDTTELLRQEVNHIENQAQEID
ncbi:DUF2732 family protein [Enterobacter sp. Bisph1]|uniref:DUF2732 family protein n=1 Tax=Enterobacter sp. Bisph1 TaxID=1274399 RepID=UPI00057C28C6|nr:DUF2732 family protein [Enterobacter sp. Bisph1]